MRQFRTLDMSFSDGHGEGLEGDSNEIRRSQARHEDLTPPKPDVLGCGGGSCPSASPLQRKERCGGTGSWPYGLRGPIGASPSAS
jgi:hypothetical protein